MKKEDFDPSELLPMDKKGILSLLQKEDREKEILLTSVLLSLSTEITSCRNRNEFLDMIKQKLAKLFPYQEIVISLLNEDGKTHSAFLYNLTEESKKHPDYKERSSEKYTLEDGIYPDILKAENLLILDLDEIMRRKYFPPYISFFYENGIRQGVAVPLQQSNKSIGAVFIWLARKYAFSDF
jgi:formate hydrogenlyase transcriptional activator